MAFKYETTRRVESESFPGVSYILKKMTEGRRLDLRSQMSEFNHRSREILREQHEIEIKPPEERDMTKWLQLQDEFDGIQLEKINPIWIRWGVKQIEGLEADGKVLTVEDWQEWPSALTAEVVEAIRNEAELNGAERKNSESPTTSGALVGGNLNPSTAESASEKDSGATGIVVPISQPE